MAKLRQGKIFKVEIDSMNSECQGIGIFDGIKIFVDGVIKSETVLVKIEKVKNAYATGNLIKVIKSSPTRVKAFCGNYEKCGGCNLQHIDYESGLEYKKNIVADNFNKYEKLKGSEILPTLGMNKPFNYRNKVQFPVSKNKKNVEIGFYKKRSHDIFDCNECEIQKNSTILIKSIIKEHIEKYNISISIYNEDKKTGLIRHIMIRDGFKTNDIMVVIVANGPTIPHENELVEKLKSVEGFKTLVLNVNTENTNIILGDKNNIIHGDGVIYDYLDKYKFKISSHSFYQVNPIQTEVLYQKIIEFAKLTGDEVIFDLYSGVGTISIFLANKGKKVYGVEVVEESVKDARENAKINEIDNVEFIEGKVEEIIPKMYKEGIKADVVIIDPPRKGCDELLLKTMADMKPSKIIYVSCNPSSLARDLRYMSDEGYEVKCVQPVDMFPWTRHVESIALIERKGQ